DRAERYALGKRLRQRVPRKSLGDWTPPLGRPDPVQQIMDSHEGRVGRLVPVRVGRMVASPYGFLRGTAVVMAEDVAHLPATGITPVVCGDSHPGCWEWDLRRLVASIWVAGRANNTSDEQCAAAVETCVAAYREEVRFLADQPLMSRSFV